MKNSSSKTLAGIILATFFMGMVILPDTTKSSFPDNGFFNWFRDQKLTLGLDLQGGTQLDYRVDLSQVHAYNNDDDPTNDRNVNDVLEGIIATFERRVNSLGVSEPNIYRSSVADEEHVIVELAGIKDIEEAKATVGKTVALEFKELREEDDDQEDPAIALMQARAQETLQEVLRSGVDFKTYGENLNASNANIEFKVHELFESNLPSQYEAILPELEIGEIYETVVEGAGEYTVGADGGLREIQTLRLIKLSGKEVRERTLEEKDSFEKVAENAGAVASTLEAKAFNDFTPVEAEAIWALSANETTDILEINEELRVYQLLDKKSSEEEVQASHILIAYQGSERAREEAQAEAQRILEEIQADPDTFETLAQTFSDDASGAEGGDLGFFARGYMVPAFEEAAFALEVGEVSQVVESDFGYHIIKATDRKAAEEERARVKFLSLSADEGNRASLEEAMTGMEGYEVTRDETHFTYEEISFDVTPSPWQSTGLDGSHFKYSTVTYDQFGLPQASIEFTQEGSRLFEELTERLVGQPLAIFVGGELITDPVVNQKIIGGQAVITGRYTLQEALKLSNDLNTGALDAPILLVGQYTISATLGENALQASLYAGLMGLIALALFMIVYYRLFGVFAVLALGIYSVIIIFLLKTTSLVMTLAGIAGIILSIGMAVDANILIFERTKEELKDGQGFVKSVETGFRRAWSSIRDSNISSLITCAILFFFGNSIIKGFAVMLALGILISMFTAITVTRAFLRSLAGSKIIQHPFLMGVKLPKPKKK